MKQFSNSFSKFFAALFFAFTLFTVACNKSDDFSDASDLETSVVDEVAVSALAAATATSSDTTITDSTKTGKCKHPGAKSGTVITFNELPDSAKAYVLANSDTATIKGIVKVTLRDSSVGYVVRYDNGTQLRFNAAGVLQPAPTRDGKSGKLTEITVAELPTAAQNYLTTNNLTASSVIKIEHDTRVAYGVRLSDNRLLVFDSEGKLLDKKGKGGKGRKG